jgi:predicted thioesterase
LILIASSREEVRHFGFIAAGVSEQTMRQIPREPRAPSTSSSSPNILRTGSRTRPPVFATPVMIMVIENAALNAIRAYLDPGESAVGTAVNVRHLVATPVGRLVSGGRQR